MGVGIIRHQLQCSLVFLDGLIELPLGEQSKGHVVTSAGTVRFELKNFLETADCFSRPANTHQRDSKVVISVGVVRLNFQRFLELDYGLVYSSHFEQGIAEIVIRIQESGSISSAFLNWFIASSIRP